MKTRLFLFLMIITTSIFGQIPDSLEVDLPWSEIYVENCDSDFGEGPTTTNKDVYISYAESEEIVIYSQEGECIRVFRKWAILSWSSGETYDYLQIVKVDPDKSFETKDVTTVLYVDLPKTFSSEDFVINPDPDHLYSFDHSDELDNTMQFTSDDILSIQTVTIYDHTAQSVNISKVVFTDCDQPVTIDIPATGTVEFSGEHFIDVTPDLLGVFVDFPCSPFTITLDNNDDIRVYAHRIGKSLNIEVEIETESGSSYSGKMEILITGTPPPPLPMYIEDKAFVAGEEITLDIWSDGIDDLVAWGLRLNFIDAEIIDITPGGSFSSIPHNIFNEGKTINSLWFPDDALPIDIGSNDTWFTLTVKPEIDGSTFDIFTTENDPWSNISIEDGIDFFTFDVDFSFQIEERNFLVSNDNTVESVAIGYNNPVNDRLILSGLTPSLSKGMITIYDLQGQKLITKSLNDDTTTEVIDVSRLVSGLYLICIDAKEKGRTFKFYKS